MVQICKFCEHEYVDPCGLDRVDLCRNFAKGTKPMDRLIGSHTMLATFYRCPKQAYHRYVLKDQPFEESEEIKWGNRVHDALDHRCGHDKKPLPDEMKQFERYASPFDSHPYVRTEVKLGMGKDGKARAFFDKENVYFRGKADLVSIRGADAFMLDWKTGRKWEDPAELEEHALLLKISHPQLQTIRGAYVWLKTMEMGKVYDLSDVAPTYRRVVDTMETMNSLKDWPARENKLCGWCGVLACKHNPRSAT